MCGLNVLQRNVSEVDGVKIGNSLPSFLRRYMDVEFSAQSLAHYQRAGELALRKLITVLEDGQIVWNAKWFRRLILLSLWPMFDTIENEIYANDLPYWMAQPNVLHQWIALAHARMGEATPDRAIPDANDPVAILRYICQDSPKVRALLSLLEDTIVVQKKVVVWVLLPAEQLFVYEIIRSLGIDARMYTSKTTQKERDEVVRQFNDDPPHTHVLILNFSMNYCGLDLHHSCWTSINIDVPISPGN